MGHAVPLDRAMSPMLQREDINEGNSGGGDNQGGGGRREVLFLCPPDDLLLSLLHVLGTEADAGLLLQASEIVRIALDTEMMGEQRASDDGGGLYEENDINAANNSGNDGNNNDCSAPGGSGGDPPSTSFSQIGAGANRGFLESEQNSFLSLFYDRYVQWLAAPFQHGIVVPRLVAPSCDLAVQMRREFQRCGKSNDSGGTFALVERVASCPVRSSLALEVLGFCVRAHVHRMKFFALRTRLLGAILDILRLRDAPSSPLPQRRLPGMRCLELATLK